MVKQSFAFPTPPLTAQPRSGHGAVALLRRLTVAAPFESQSLTYRTGEFSYERDPYAEFLVPPEQALTGPVRGFLLSTGAFASVTLPGSAEKPDKIVEMAVEELYGDFRNKTAPKAVLTLRVTCFEAEGRAAGRILLEKAYSEHMPLRSRTAEGVVAGLNEALKRALGEAGPDLKQVAAKPASITP